mmetsp:Transcript_89213/g.241979  ORF Transcript_89213/g.241979 Transcript_89213/m.241979 type:complete len:478 (-) Transcript_89213:154-1587(-)
MATQLRKRRQRHPEVVYQPVDRLRGLLREHGHATHLALAALRAHVGVALEVAPVVVHARGALHARAAGVDAAGGLRRVAPEVRLLLEEHDLRPGLAGLDGRADAGEAAPDDHHVRRLVAPEAILAVLRHLRAGLLQPHDAGPGAGVEEVVHHRVLQRTAAEGVEQLAAGRHGAHGQGGGGQRVGQHARTTDHGGARAGVPGDLHRSARARVEHVRHAGGERLLVVPRGGNGLPVAQVDVGDVRRALPRRRADALDAGRLHDGHVPVAARRVFPGDLDVTAPVHVAGGESRLFELLGHLVDGPALGQAAEVQLRAGVRLLQARVREGERGPPAVGSHLTRRGIALLEVPGEGQHGRVEGAPGHPVQSRREREHLPHGGGGRMHLVRAELVDRGHLAAVDEVAEDGLRLLGHAVQDLLRPGASLCALLPGRHHHRDLVRHAAPDPLEDVQLALLLPLVQQHVVLWRRPLRSGPASAHHL